MICVICTRAQIADGFTSVVFVRDEMKLLVKNVPAQVCPGCGEVFLDEQVTERLLRAAEEISQVRQMDVEVECSDLA
jgi:YgiT-type zinc finger domain-containing protein